MRIWETDLIDYRARYTWIDFNKRDLTPLECLAQRLNGRAYEPAKTRGQKRIHRIYFEPARIEQEAGAPRGFRYWLEFENGKPASVKSGVAKVWRLNGASFDIETAALEAFGKYLKQFI